MRISTGKVHGGVIELEGVQLAEGSTVTILATDGDETFALDPVDEARLLEAVEEANRGMAIDASQVLAQIRPV
jgi:hypothetical protein